MSKRALSREAIDHKLEAEDAGALDASQIAALVRRELGASAFLPDGRCQVDPRSGDRIIYNSARAARPHDNKVHAPPATNDRPCVICEGKLTGIVDLAALSEGFSFISKNLYPVLFPAWNGAGEGGPEGLPAYGMHFVQWSSSDHDRDWHNLPQGDREVLVRRLAVLERSLLTGDDRLGDDISPPGYVGIIKNYGSLVGGSLAHGHQQVVLSSVPPRRLLDNARFERDQQERYADYILRENDDALTVADYGAARLLVPHFMRRPFDMQLVVTRTSRRHLFELDEAEISAVARGWHDALRLIYAVMPRLGRELAYNVITHNGPGAGLYFDFLPYTQEQGGYEHLGLILCQAEPLQVAEQARQLLSELG